jgi:hypothetical protein
MMEAPPTAALIMPEANFLFEVFIIALDAPAHLGEIDKAAEQHVLVSTTLGPTPAFRAARICSSAITSTLICNNFLFYLSETISKKVKKRRSN